MTYHDMNKYILTKIEQSNTQPNNQPTNQSINQSTIQTTIQTIKQVIKQPLIVAFTCFLQLLQKNHCHQALTIVKRKMVSQIGAPSTSIKSRDQGYKCAGAPFRTSQNKSWGSGAATLEKKHLPQGLGWFDHMIWIIIQKMKGIERLA